MLDALGPPPLTRSVKRQSVHHLPRFSKFTWAVIICFAVFATALWFAGGRCEVRIHHAGYTNTPNTETRYAAYGVFVITNVGSGNVTLWPEFLLEGEGKTKRRWKAPLMSEPGSYPEGRLGKWCPLLYPWTSGGLRYCAHLTAFAPI